jgi:hypothetical protein
VLNFANVNATLLGPFVSYEENDVLGNTAPECSCRVWVNQHNRFPPNICGFLLPARPQWVEPAGRWEQKSGGEQKSADVEWRMVTLIYPYPFLYESEKWEVTLIKRVVRLLNKLVPFRTCPRCWRQVLFAVKMIKKIFFVSKTSSTLCRHLHKNYVSNKISFEQKWTWDFGSRLKMIQKSSGQKNIEVMFSNLTILLSNMRKCRVIIFKF